MKISLLSLGVILISVAASSQTFKHHKIGETAEQFFSVATMGESNESTTTFCTRYLSDPKVLKAFEKAQRNTLDLRANNESGYVTGCRDVQDALRGKHVEVGGRYALELGRGTVTFHNSKLVIMAFHVNGTLEDVITDVTKELGGISPTLSVETLQNGFGATLQQRKALWASNDLTVLASEVRDFQYGDQGITVVVADREYYRQKEAERQASRPSTIH
jgi:hypothetical protein